MNVDECWQTKLAETTKISVERDQLAFRKRTCPIDHQCMTGISVEMVAAPVRAALTSQDVVREHHS